MASPKRHLECKIKRTYSCSVCGKNLSSTVALSSHLKTHSGIKSFCCEHCGAMYSTKQNLIAHLIRVHGLSAETIRECNICGKQFFKKSSFVTHYLIHSSQKTFHCHICNRYFRQKVTRDSHIAATHTGEYKYSCSKCGKKFFSSYKLKVHQQKHSDDICEKQIRVYDDDLKLRDKRLQEVNDSLHLTTNSVSDDECSRKSFRNKAQRKINILRSHTPTRSSSHDKISYKLTPNTEDFFCAECFKHFKTLQGFEYHRKAHEGIYNYICEICGKLFLRNTHLVSHIKLHSDIRPYKCDFCEKSYKSNKNLKEHLITKHSST